MKKEKSSEKLKQCSRITEKLAGLKIIRKLKTTRAPRWRLPRLSSTVVLLIILGATIFMLGGGIYDVVMKPIALAFTPGGGSYFFIPRDLNSQTLNESIYFMFFVSIGIAGGYTAQRSVRYLHKPRQAGLFMLIGTLMILIGFIGAWTVLDWKLHPENFRSI